MTFNNECKNIKLTILLLCIAFLNCNEIMSDDVSSNKQNQGYNLETQLIYSRSYKLINLNTLNFIKKMMIKIQRNI